MLGLLQAPELWIGLGLCFGLFIFAFGGSERRRMNERIERIAQQKPRQAATGVGSLRKRDPADGRSSVIEKLRAKLEVAGINATPGKFLLITPGIFLLVSLAMLAWGRSPLLSLLVGLMLGLGLPNRYLSMKMKRRKNMIIIQLPDAIDLIVRGLRAGLPVSESFQTVSREIPNPLGGLFGMMSQQIGLGVPVEKALGDAARNVELTEFDFFVTTIILQRETGGNLGEILSNLAEVLRQRRMMKLKIAAISSEAKASGYIVGSLPFVVLGLLSLIAADYIAPLFTDFRGNIAMAVAAISMGTGAFIMRKMTQFEI